MNYLRRNLPSSRRNDLYVPTSPPIGERPVEPLLGVGFSGVVMGRAPEGATHGNAPVNADGPVEVLGRVLGGPEASTGHALSGETKLVMCANCNHRNTAPASATLIDCENCGSRLLAGTQAATNVTCCSCSTVNLVAPGVGRFKCGSCQTLMDVPGAGPPQAEIDAREEDDLQRALQASMRDF